MKLVKTKVNLLTRSKNYDGLLEAKFEHKVASTEGTIVYHGPKIPPAEWHKMLSFFRWTYSTTKSESQVRLYVNTLQGTWSAWAYPQEARTGMSAKELDTPDAKTQRAQFPDSSGWVYFGTVHHHCSASAFQSGTDQSNEEGQDGLHITIGGIDRDKHDLHCRFYLAGDEFSPDMSLFWDIGDEARRLLPPDLHDRIARWQMGAKVETPFPDQWKENLIEVKSLGVRTWETNGPSSSTGYWKDGSYFSSQSTIRPAWQRARDAIEQIEREMNIFRVETEEMEATLTTLKEDQACGIILDALHEYSLTIDQLIDEWDDETRRGLGTAGEANLLTQGERDAAEHTRQKEQQDTDYTGWPHGYMQ